MAAEIEAEFKKSKDYALVDSAEKADLVFLAEGQYLSYWQDIGQIRINCTLADYSVGFGRHFCEAAMAIVIPSEIYIRNPADGEALLSARQWEGISFYKPIDPSLGVSRKYGRDTHDFDRPASFKDLVKDFLKKKKWPDLIPPIHAASADAPARITGRNAVTAGEEGRIVPPVEIPKVAVADQVIRVDTTMVIVPVFATDGSGRRVPGLSVENFHLYEDGVEQEIDRFVSESAPIQTALVMDISQSTGTLREGIKSAGLAFASGLRPEDGRGHIIDQQDFCRIRVYRRSGTAAARDCPISYAGWYTLCGKRRIPHAFRQEQEY